MSNKGVFMINLVIINTAKQERDRITAILSTQTDVTIQAQGKDGYDAIRLTDSLKPDIVLLDNYPELMDGEELPPLLKARSPSTAVVILTGRISDYQLYMAAKGKVSGFIYKETEMELLSQILKHIFQGGCFISPVLAARILHLFSANRGRPGNSFRTNKNPQIPFRRDPIEHLSKMELRILTYIGEGYTSGEIAGKLDLAVGTVRNYISSVMRKTDLHNRSQMASFACYHGLVQF